MLTEKYIVINKYINRIFFIFLIYIQFIKQRFYNIIGEYIHKRYICIKEKKLNDSLKIEGE